MRFNYRPKWGLPGTVPPEQTGAPVLGFSRENIAPGDIASVVIVPLFPDVVPQWSAVDAGSELSMYEGASVCGTGRVIWREDTVLPLPAADEARFLAWLAKR